jgi:hypothetical protein
MIRRQSPTGQKLSSDLGAIATLIRGTLCALFCLDIRLTLHCKTAKFQINLGDTSLSVATRPPLYNHFLPNTI